MVALGIICGILNVIFIWIIVRICVLTPLDGPAILDLVIMILVMGYFNYLFFEKFYNAKIRKSFKYIIHVNGIRGKSTTTRLIDAGMRACGFKVFSKTTGTVPTMIKTNNEDEVINRLGKANIREQLKILKKAYKEKADVVVLECMAVNPELQYISEHQILNADVTVITNVRPDHLQDMGETLEDIATAFCGTIPTNGHLVINPGEYQNMFIKEAKKLNTKVHLATPYEGEDNLDTFAENIQLALEVASTLELDKETFFEGMKQYHHDMGAFEAIKLNGTIFLNGFSINDPVSIKVVYDKIIETYDKNKLTILLNSRNDRPTRVMQHIEMMKELESKKIIVSGSNNDYIKSRLAKLYPEREIAILNNQDDLFKEEVVFAIGNIGGLGMKILTYFQENGERI